MKARTATLAGIGILALAILVGGIARSEQSPAATKPERRHHHMMMHGMEGLGVPLPILLKAANLTDAQKAQVKKIFEGKRAAVMPLVEQIHSAQQQIAVKLWTSGTVSTSDLSQPLQQVTEARDKLLQQQVSATVEIRNLLNADQLQKVAQAEKDFEARRAQWMQSHRHGAKSESAPSDAATPAPSSNESGRVRARGGGSRAASAQSLLQSQMNAGISECGYRSHLVREIRRCRAVRRLLAARELRARA
jgi:Spy/CpxP family protein refolding chaperone